MNKYIAMKLLFSMEKLRYFGQKLYGTKPKNMELRFNMGKTMVQ